VTPPDRAVIYRREQVRTLPLYQRGIAGCLHRDAHEASEALIELILTLNFEYEDAAGELFSLYDLCLRKVKAGRFDVVGQILHDLRAAWMGPMTAR